MGGHIITMLLPPNPLLLCTPMYTVEKWASTTQGLTHCLGFWKAEELQKFAFPASEYVLGGLLPDEEYHIWILVARLTELVFGAGRYGWTAEMLELAHLLILRHNILVEELQGLKSCKVTVHNLLHLLEDVERFPLLTIIGAFHLSERSTGTLSGPLRRRTLNTLLQGLRADESF